MHKKVVFLKVQQGPQSPSYQRSYAFKAFFKKNRIIVSEIYPPSCVYSYVKIIFHLYKTSPQELWVSMPPFRFWFLLALPGIKVTLDIRDGWSIAMKSGYGQSANEKPVKAIFASMFEFYGLCMCSKMIVCTPGLLEYYKKKFPRFLTKKIILIANGYQSESNTIANKCNRMLLSTNKSEKLLCVCAGKFGEYGRKNAEMAIYAILRRYKYRDIHLAIIGADPSCNAWVNDFVKKLNRSVCVSLEPRLSLEELHMRIDQAHLGIALVRDPEYELGTKAYDYIAHGIPILNYFDKENNFTRYFYNFLDTSYSNNGLRHVFSRQYQVERHAGLLLDL
jgi:hypothetical protein